MLAATAALGGLLTAAAAVSHPAGAAASQAAPAASADAPIALGIDAKKVKGATQSKALLAAESAIGRKAAFTRDYLLWDDPFPTSFEYWLAQRGTVPMISVKSRLENGTAVPWASVADAQPGSALYDQIVNWADRIRDFGYPVYFTYTHEPETATNKDLGTPADYIAAWQHVHDIFVAQGATNVRFMWIMTAFSFRVGKNDRRYGWKWYPGDQYVDAIGADAYNWNTCMSPSGTWNDFATVLSGFMTFAAQHPSEPLWITEFGSVEDPKAPDAKANWISGAESLLQQPAYSRIQGVAWFNISQASNSCYWPIDSSPAATTAFATLAQDPAFSGSAAFTPTTTPPPDTSGAPAFRSSSSTIANATRETVTVPADAASGDGLVLVATSAAPGALTAPSGWTTVASTSSATMSSAVWQRVAAGSDAGTGVTVTFPKLTQGSVELLDYSGTSAAGPVTDAVAATRETATTTLTTPSVTAGDGTTVVSYWASRTSADTTITPPSAVTARSAETGSGGARITSTSADSATGAARTAGVDPSTSHGVTWSIVLG